MAQVRINRELLTDILECLEEYHNSVGCRCDNGGDCVLSQRIQRGRRAVERADFQTSAAPV